MFGSSKPVVLQPYGRRRTRASVPRWLLLWLVGVAAGAGAVVWVQERYLPPRLSAEASAALRTAFDKADAERQRLAGELAGTAKRLDAALTEKKALGAELAGGRAVAERLQGDLAAVVAALPADPRGGSVEVRAARFSAQGGALGYDVVLTRERAAGKPLAGVMQLLVTGESARGGSSTVSLKPVAVAIGGHEVLRGSLPLPEGFKPLQTTIQVLDRAGGKVLGMRVLPVK